MTSVTCKEACALLQGKERVLLLCHRSPDGDTLGSAFALRCALGRLGKQVRVECSDEIPKKYRPFIGFPSEEAFEPDAIVAVDIADTQLFGAGLEPYIGRVDLCIDHHPSNTGYADYLLLQPDAAATCELIYQIIRLLNVEIDKYIANCLYLGLATDTGCFRYTNVTACTHQIASELIRYGAEHGAINQAMFETKSRGQIEIERLAMNTIEFAFDGRCAMIYITREMLAAAHATEEELDGISAKPRQIEGVQVGVTLRQRQEGGFKISMRTNEPLDASVVCGRLGGGGHARAAGCFIDGDLAAAKEKIRQALSEFLR